MTLSPPDAYAAWAPTYDAETPVSLLDDDALRTWPRSDGPLLDVGCGTGRRGPAGAFGVDRSRAMLRAGRARGMNGRAAAADARALPFGPARFATVWCRLVLGHLPDVAAAYREMARVLAAGGTAIVTDFHPAAVAAGHTRGFRDAGGAARVVEHHVHTVEDHARAAAGAGLVLAEIRDLTVGPTVRACYADADRLAWYERDRGLPLVLALRLTR